MDEIKNPEDGLEMIAKKAAEGAHFEFNPDAWDAMEKRLNAPVKNPSSWWKIIGPGILLVILSLTNFWPIDKAILRDDVTEEESISDQKLIGKKSNEVKAAELKNEAPSQTQDGSLGIDQANIQTTDSNKIIEPAATARKSSSSLTKKVKTTIEQNIISLASQPNQENPSMGNQEAELDEIGIESIFISWIPGNYPSYLNLGPYETINSILTTEDSLQQFKRWSFGVLVSMDLSATGLDGFTKPGTMVGAFAEYRILKNWSILSGASYAIKKYTALGSEYVTPSWIAARPDDLLAVSANCIVIDIPLNLKRYFKTKKGKNWFVSTGVSSYLMLREDYTYDYSEQRPNWLETWSVKNQNNHYLGIANLSVGFETPINKKLGLSIEPFIKLPLTGIGQGKVKFLSFGTNVAIKLK
jgi:hypothetical protein